MSVSPVQRFHHARPCPVCGGHKDSPSGHGSRCFGFLSSDGAWAHCTREEFAGGLDRNSHDDTFAHRLGGDCRCGKRHDGSPPSNGINAGSTAPRGRGNPIREKVYSLRDQSGSVVAEHVRLDFADFPKECIWRRNGRAGLDGLKVVDLPLYGIERLAGWEKSQGRWVALVEGEKAAEALVRAGLPALGTVTGAGMSEDKCPSEATLEPLRGWTVVLWPDNDDVGRRHMELIARRLAGLGAEVRHFTWTDAPAKGDAADYLGQGGDVDELRRALAAAPIVPSSNGHNAPTRSGASVSAVTLSLASVAPTRVSWLWKGRIPLGKLTILDGDPGLGKSLLTLDVAARVSMGNAMPDGSASGLAGPAGVVLLALEDDPADTIRPRLDAAGADATRVALLTAVNEVKVGKDGEQEIVTRLPILTDVEALREAITTHQAKLLIVDPVMAYMSGDTHVDSEVRQVLVRLATLAQETGCAVLVVRHLNKAGGSNALYRGGGSIAFVASARSGLLVAKDPDDEARRVLVSTKCNLAELPPALAYGVRSTDDLAAHVVWHGETQHTASQLLSAPTDDETRSALDEAKGFLREVLGRNEVPSKDVQAAARNAGIADQTLRRAREALGVQIRREGFGKELTSHWSLEAGADQQTSGQGDLSNPTSSVQQKRVNKTGNLEQNWPDRMPAVSDEQPRAEPLESANGHDASAVLALADSLGWRKIELSRGVSVGGDEAAWRHWASKAPPERLELAHSRLGEAAEAPPLAGMGVA